MASARPSTVMILAEFLDQQFPHTHDQFTLLRLDSQPISSRIYHAGSSEPAEVKEVPHTIQTEFNRIEQLEEPDLIAEEITKFNKRFSPWHIKHTHTRIIETAEQEKDILARQKIAETLGMSKFLDEAYAKTLSTGKVELFEEAELDLMFSYVDQWLEKNPLQKGNFQKEVTRLENNNNQPDAIKTLFISSILYPALISYHTQLNHYSGRNLTQGDIEESADENCRAEVVHTRAEAFLKELLSAEPAQAAAASSVKSPMPGK